MNDEGSARRAAQNATELLGSWVRGTMQGGGTAWLKTTQETWEFRDDLTYDYKRQSYEGGSTGAWRIFRQVTRSLHPVSNLASGDRATVARPAAYYI